MADNSKLQIQSIDVSLLPSESNELFDFESMSRLSADSTLTIQHLQGYQNKGQLLSIKVAQNAVGFLAFRTTIDEAELDQIILADEYRHQHIGRYALELWHKQLLSQGICKVFLDVRESNLAAVSLYKKTGYEIVGARKNYYSFAGEKVNALLMTHFLGSQ